jgi:hypothetical protein
MVRGNISHILEISAITEKHAVVTSVLEEYQRLKWYVPPKTLVTTCKTTWYQPRRSQLAFSPL